MDIKVFETKEEIAQICADMFEAQLKEKAHPVLGLATGDSPVPTYRELIDRYKKGRISFRNASSFNLDEYCALPAEDRNSYISFMKENLFDHVDIPCERIHIPNGNAADMEEECRNYDASIKEAGGIDIQLLGIGRNGHIGFNEPAPFFTKGTHVVKLQQSTIDANARFFTDGKCPTAAVTMGIASIFSAKKIVLIATGEEKADAVFHAVKGQISPSECPASILQLHPDTTFLLDEKAASKL